MHVVVGFVLSRTMASVSTVSTTQEAKVYFSIFYTFLLPFRKKLSSKDNVGCIFFDAQNALTLISATARFAEEISLQ